MDGNSKYNKFLSKLNPFLESKIFMIILGAFTVLSWYFKWNYIPYIVLCIAMLLIIITKTSFVSIASLFFIYVAGNQNNDMNVKSVGFYIILLFAIPTLILLIIDYVKGWKSYLTRFKSDYLLYSLILLFIAMLISIINSPVKGLTIGYALTFSMNIFFAILILTKVELNDENKEKVVFSMMIILWTVAFQVLFKYISIYEKGHMWEKLINKQLHLGWFLSNHYMPIVNIGMLSSIYLYIKSDKVYNKIFSIITIFVGIILNIVTMCRGGYFGLIPAGLLCIIAYIIYTQEWKKELPYLISVLSILVVSLIILSSTGVLKDGIEHLKKIGSSLNGRSEVYQLGIDKFKENWIIGTGAGSSAYYIHSEILNPAINWVNNYHNAFIQIASTCGIIGLVSFLIYLLLLLRRIIYKDLYSFFVIIIFVYFFTHGMVDTLFFNKKIMPLFTILMFMMRNSLEKDEFSLGLK